MDNFEYKTEAEKTIKKLKEQIAELEKENSELKHDLDEYISNANLMATEVVANAEPVALMRKTDITEFIEYNMEMAENDNPQAFAKWIPLYTTPQTKPLSDEEIDKLEDKFLSINNEYGEDLYIIGLYEFARAIEERILGK